MFAPPFAGVVRPLAICSSRALTTGNFATRSAVVSAFSFQPLQNPQTVAAAEPYAMLVPAQDSSVTRCQAVPLRYGVGASRSDLEGPASWVAVYTKQHHEKRIAEYLADQSFDCYLPLYTSERRWSNHRTAIIQMPLFPTYLFARISPRMRVRILRTPGVLGIVGRGSNDCAISDREIEILRSGLHLRHPEPHGFAVGESVRIAAGPLKGIQGTVVRYNSSFRVVITVPMIQQSVSVEVAAAELEPLCSSRARAVAIA